MHGRFDAEADHLFGELGIAEEKVNEKLEFGFDFGEYVGTLEQFW